MVALFFIAPSANFYACVKAGRPNYDSNVKSAEG
jgi:hypothetical protein